MFTHFKDNLKPGLSVALVSVPMAISLSIVCGGTPVMGLLSGVWAGIMAALFCSSPHNAYGPAGALAGILLPLSLQYGIAYFPIVAFGSGCVMLLIGVLGLSKYLSIIPGSVLQGFLLGIALIIGLQQIPAILGLPLDIDVLEALHHIGSARGITILLFCISLAILQLCRKFFPWMPGIIIVTLLGVAIGRYDAMHGIWGVDKLVDIYGEIGFTLFQGESLSGYTSLLRQPGVLRPLITASLGVAVIALLETLISAKIATKNTRVPFSSQREVYGLGITNMITGLVGGMPVSALVPRTTLNIDMGATHKRSGALIGICTGVFAMFFFNNALQFLPFAIIAGILVDIALGMFNLSLYHKLRNTEKSSIGIIGLVGLISYLWDPMIGILIGTTLALMMVVMRAMKRDLITNVFRDGHHIEKTKLISYIDNQHTDDTVLIKLEGELNYLNTENHTHLLRQLKKPSRIILGFGYTCLMDNDASEELDIIIQEYLHQDKKVYITGLEGQNLALLGLGEGYQKLKQMGHIYESKSKLLEHLL